MEKNPSPFSGSEHPLIPNGIGASLEDGPCRKNKDEIGVIRQGVVAQLLPLLCPGSSAPGSDEPSTDMKVVANRLVMGCSFRGFPALVDSATKPESGLWLSHEAQFRPWEKPWM